MTCDTYSPTFSGISTAKPLHDPTSIIKDEPNGSEDTQIQFNENVEDDDDQEENFEKNSIKYEEEEIKENNHEEKLEPKDIIVSIKDANEDSSSRSSSSEAEDVKDEPAQNIDAILGKFFPKNLDLESNARTLIWVYLCTRHEFKGFLAKKTGL